MPPSLHISALAAGFGARPLIADLDLVVGPGDVIAAVGPNGAGKSTLLRIVAGEHVPDSGAVRTSPADATVGYLPQSPPRGDETILEYAARRTGVAAAQIEFDCATAALTAGEYGADDRYAVALERWLALGGGDLDARLGETLARVGLDVAPDKPLGELSGGQAARASLASILLSRHDILLLDEPTNNLDQAGLGVLAAYLRVLSGPVVVASHDRRFLDDVATAVLELDLHQQAVNHYTGGWSEYRAAKALARSQAVAAYETYTAERDTLIARARRQGEWAAKGRAQKADLGPHGGIAKKYAEDQAKRMDQRAARARAAAERLDVVEQPRKEWELRYTIAHAPPSADVVLTLDHVEVKRGDFRLGPVSTHLARGERVALLGPNGSGKSTLLQAILGQTPIDAGRLSWGGRVQIGTLDQSRDLLNGDDDLLDAMARALRTTDMAEVRTLLAKFGLGADAIGRPCSSLSLGERTRAGLAILQRRAVNTLILDEPTNHLDVDGIQQLEAALAAFDGTMLVVTHDRTMLDDLGTTQEWRLDRRGNSANLTVEHR